MIHIGKKEYWLWLWQLGHVNHHVIHVFSKQNLLFQNVTGDFSVETVKHTVKDVYWIYVIQWMDYVITTLTVNLVLFSRTTATIVRKWLVLCIIPYWMHQPFSVPVVCGIFKKRNYDTNLVDRNINIMQGFAIVVHFIKHFIRGKHDFYFLLQMLYD